MFKKILIPTDGSALATQAALEGIELAKKVGAEVVCIFVAAENQTAVFDFAHVKMDNHWPTNEEYEKAVKRAAKEFMTPIRDAAAKAGIKLTEQTYISNSPALYIVSAAEKNGCDLIYMASRGRAGWEKMLLGSVAAQVITASPIPVLVFKVKKEQLPPKAQQIAYPDLIPMV